MPQDEQQTQDVNMNAAEPVLDAEKDLEQEVVNKIAEARNILVALSGDPSVDELASAIGLTLYLDKIGKKATAIYSGATPNALEFLKPEETFDTTADVLQDFVIALNKEKADHLRYKIDGDYVKIFITPFKERIAQEDFEFYYGDYNVDLVIALDVLNGIDLDAALREHGRIMHDAVVINVTTGKPGKFGEIEWCDPKASSVSEMFAGLIYRINNKVSMEKEEATAFLTGIVAATNRFANARTTATTMRMASKLIESGANQQLVAKNITDDTDNEMYSLSFNNTAKKVEENTLDVAEGAEGAEISTTVNEEKSTLLDELKAAEASLAGAGAETLPEEKDQTLKIKDGQEIVEEAAPVVEAPETPVEETPKSEEMPVASMGEKIIPVPEGGMNANYETDSEKYGRMLREALAGDNPAAMSAPEISSVPEVEAMPEMDFGSLPEEAPVVSAEVPAATVEAPAETVEAPVASSVTPQDNVVTPQENVVAPEAEILPPPPAPEIPNGPVMPDGTTFKIPGM